MKNSKIKLENKKDINIDLCCQKEKNNCVWAKENYCPCPNCLEKLNKCTCLLDIKMEEGNDKLN